MADEKVDLEPVVREELPGILAQPFDAAIEALHILERRTRIAKDDNANTIVCREVVNLCISQTRWSDLGTNVSILAKRRGYSRRAVTEILKLSMDALASIGDQETHISLVQSLRDVTEGKIFVEVERAHLTQILVKHLETKGELVEAMNLLQDLRLEILTSMPPVDRIGLMLHQFRLCLDAKDQLRASLCAEKVKDQKVEDAQLRLLFLDLLIRYHSEFTKDFLAIADSWYETYKLNHSGAALLNAIVSAVLAPHSPEQTRFCAQLQQVKDLTLMPDAKSLLAVFLGRDLVPWAEFEPKFEQIIPADNREVMRQRVIEHSLRVVAMYYTNIRLARLAELEQITVNELEDRIVDLVFNEGFYAKIDRPKGIITFKRKQKVAEVADEFSSNIMKLCKLVDQAHSLIEKERQCIHRQKV
jgi:hypothetical protein